MPWAIELPSVFNDFSPDGEHEGYREQLAAYHATATDLEDCEKWVATYARRVTTKFHSEFGNPHEPPLTPIKPHEWPLVFKLRKPHKRLGSLIEMPNRILAVDDALKAIIEELEPGVHQFNPIKVLSSKREELWGKYHVLVISRFLTSFRPEQSSPELLKKEGYPVPIFFIPQVYAQMAMSAAEIQNAHLWRERGAFGGGHIFISDTLQSAIADAGLRIPPHCKAKLV